ncbi:MAG: hypothetical protein HDP28_01320 [Clostridia bacterium]|jgi:hypothetical protein|nr:hypothetical protein [Clostridia bacterium]
MFNESLSKRENAVMSAVFQLSEGKERFLVAPYELLALLPPRQNFNEEKLYRTLRSLELDGYFELIESDRKGEPVFVVHMREAGRSFRRSDALRKRRIYYKIAVTLLCGALSALVGILVKSLLG